MSNFDLRSTNSTDFHLMQQFIESHRQIASEELEVRFIQEHGKDLHIPKNEESLSAYVSHLHKALKSELAPITGSNPPPLAGGMFGSSQAILMKHGQDGPKTGGSGLAKSDPTQMVKALIKVQETSGPLSRAKLITIKDYVSKHHGEEASIAALVEAVTSLDQKKLTQDGISYVMELKNQLELTKKAAKLGDCMVRSGEQMSKIGIRFPDEYTPIKLNSALWEYNDGKFLVKHGLKPSDAINDLTKNPSQYCIDCGMSVKFIQYKALLEMMGPDGFNKKFPNLAIGKGITEGPLLAMQSRISSQQDPTIKPPIAPSNFEETLKPGDIVIIDNPDANPEARALGWGAENCIYMGKINGENVYFAHPMSQEYGFITKEKIINELSKRMSPGAHQAPWFRDERYFLNPSAI